MRTKSGFIRPLTLGLAFAVSALIQAKEISVTSPDGHLTVVVSDTDGLSNRVELDGQPLLADSQLGLEFADGLTLGPSAQLSNTRQQSHDGFWIIRLSTINQKTNSPTDCSDQHRLEIHEVAFVLNLRTKSISMR